jgi:uncharacterized protein YecE (DUF72 family)
MLYLGTSGYSYDDWVGPFYPEGTAKKDFFAHYLRFFNAVEINFTHYTLPSTRTIGAIAAKAPDTFRFAVKSHQDMTLGLSQDRELYANYRAGIEPLFAQGKLCAVLLQFPNAFNLSRPHVNHLAFIRDQWPGLPLAVEFRHRSWIDEARSFDFLREQRIAYCCVDEPRMSDLVPPVTAITADFAYVRFHGRNAANWYGGEHSWSRYDYLYSAEELREWIQPVRELQGQVDDVLVFFNNHYSGSAVQNALQFAELLGPAPAP